MGCKVRQCKSHRMVVKLSTMMLYGLGQRVGKLSKLLEGYSRHTVIDWLRGRYINQKGKSHRRLVAVRT